MLKDILYFHSRQYPLMQPADAVKLLYQNEFGVGHLISSPSSFKKRLEEEFKTAAPQRNIRLTEDIGNGMIRVMLNAPGSLSLDPEKLADACIRTAAEHHGSLNKFLEKINVLKKCCEEGFFGFTPAVLDFWLETYKSEGYPLISHSEVYRRSYAPAYRVVKAELFNR